LHRRGAPPPQVELGARRCHEGSWSSGALPRRWWSALFSGGSRPHRWLPPVIVGGSSSPSVAPCVVELSRAPRHRWGPVVVPLLRWRLPVVVRGPRPRRWLLPVIVGGSSSPSVTPCVVEGSRRWWFPFATSGPSWSLQAPCLWSRPPFPALVFAPFCLVPSFAPPIYVETK
jgi:hypothetical protein